MTDPTTLKWLEGIDQLLVVGARLAVVLAVAFLVASWLTTLQARLRERQGPIARLVPWLPVAQIAVWVLAGTAGVALLLEAPPVVIVAFLVPSTLAIVIASKDLARNAIAGAALAFEHSILAGDSIDITGPDTEIRGQVIAIGVRRTQLRRPDGTEVMVPNHTLLNSTVRTNRAHEQDSAVEIELAFESTFDAEEFAAVRELARRAAAVSRFASPHHAPEVFLEPDGDGSYRLTVQAFAFAPHYARHLRTDVVAIFQEERSGR